MANESVKQNTQQSWYLISEYSDSGDFDILGIGDEAEMRSLFQRSLESQKLVSPNDVRNTTDFQFEVWVEEHYQNSMKPGIAYTVKLLQYLPRFQKH